MLEVRYDHTVISVQETQTCFFLCSVSRLLLPAQSHHQFLSLSFLMRRCRRENGSDEAERGSESTGGTTLVYNYTCVAGKS